MYNSFFSSVSYGSNEIVLEAQRSCYCLASSLPLIAISYPWLTSINPFDDLMTIVTDGLSVTADIIRFVSVGINSLFGY